MSIDCSVASIFLFILFKFCWAETPVLIIAPVTLHLCQKDGRQRLHSNKDRADKAEGILLYLKGRETLASGNLALRWHLERANDPSLIDVTCLKNTQKRRKFKLNTSNNAVGAYCVTELSIYLLFCICSPCIWCRINVTSQLSLTWFSACWESIIGGGGVWLWSGTTHTSCGIAGQWGLKSVSNSLAAYPHLASFFAKPQTLIQ